MVSKAKKAKSNDFGLTNFTHIEAAIGTPEVQGSLQQP